MEDRTQNLSAGGGVQQHPIATDTSLPITTTSPSITRHPGCTYPAFLHQVGDHDDHAAVLLPHHAPEVLKGGLKRTLGRNVGFGFVVALNNRERERGWKQGE